LLLKKQDKKGVKISFKEFTRTGVIVTTLTILISILILTVEHELGFLV
jgi:Na+/H+ antiporter NhaD/arsenite permease-like protein